MGSLKCWFAGSREPSDHSYVDVVFAKTHREARKVVWAKGTEIVDECANEFTKLRLTRKSEFDHLADADAKDAYVCRDDKTLRLMGWEIEGDARCGSCGLASFEGEYPVCEECWQCCECGHDDDCESKGTNHQKGDYPSCAEDLEDPDDPGEMPDGTSLCRQGW